MSIRKYNDINLTTVKDNTYPILKSKTQTIDRVAIESSSTTLNYQYKTTTNDKTNYDYVSVDCLVERFFIQYGGFKVGSAINVGFGKYESKLTYCGRNTHYVDLPLTHKLNDTSENSHIINGKSYLPPIAQIRFIKTTAYEVLKNGTRIQITSNELQNFKTLDHKVQEALNSRAQQANLPAAINNQNPWAFLAQVPYYSYNPDPLLIESEKYLGIYVPEGEQKLKSALYYYKDYQVFKKNFLLNNKTQQYSSGLFDVIIDDLIRPYFDAIHNIPNITKTKLSQ